MEIFDELESNVRAYIRDFPVVFCRAKGHRLWTEDGTEFIDFFCGAGALNYGHNPDRIKPELIRYLEEDGVVHALDMATAAKARFLERFREVILEPREMPHKILFPGPTGTNAIEAAFKIARKATGRETIVSFTNGFHGMTLGALAATGNAMKRGGAGVPLNNTTPMPYDGYLGDDVDTLDMLSRMVEDSGSGLDHPAAVVVETLQGEGGLSHASSDWLRRLERLCHEHGILLIVDDIQAGCGRTGPFFSYERAGISPDLVCLSKSIGGYGLPMALVLVKPEHDVFQPGEHNGTFRGNNPAFVAATAALTYWEDNTLEQAVEAKGRKVRATLKQLEDILPGKSEVRGRGLMRGIALEEPGLAEEVCTAAFRHGLLLETAGPDSEVVKVMPPLTIDDVGLEKGLHILVAAARDAARARGKAKDVA